MSKAEGRGSRAVKPLPVSASGRRHPLAVEPATRPAQAAGERRHRRRPQTEAERLVAEVERLERELDAARRRMAVLEAHAEIDPLTGLLNRRGFERELARALAHTKRYGASAALLFIDLDGLKPVNDRHGHAAGDAVLQAVAAVLARHVRASDLVARLAGDEFAVLLWHVGQADAEHKAALLEAVISRTTATHVGTALAVGASVGAAPLLPLDAPADVLERADRAMYARKRAGKAAAGS
jgi:diguanylate cyclase (GGDEF)-like protein